MSDGDFRWDNVDTFQTQPTNFNPTLFGANSTSWTLPFESASLARSAHLLPLLLGSPSHSSQILTVRSKEHEAKHCPNSGCAQLTFKIDESWAFQESLRVQAPVASSRSQTLIRWSEEHVIIRLPYQSVAMSWIRSSCCAANCFSFGGLVPIPIERERRVRIAVNRRVSRGIDPESRRIVRIYLVNWFERHLSRLLKDLKVVACLVLLGRALLAGLASHHLHLWHSPNASLYRVAAPQIL